MALFCSRKARIVVLLGLSFGFIACSDDNKVVKKTAKEKPAAAVVIGYVEQQRVANEIEAVGTLIANESVQITASVTDNITRVNFEDGQTVKKGDVLVTLTNDEQIAELDNILRDQGINNSNEQEEQELEEAFMNFSGFNSSKDEVLKLGIIGLITYLALKD